jgi:hypothetical protein
MPCAGGSPWQTLNIHRGVGLTKIEQYWVDFELLWGNFLLAAKAVKNIDGVVAIEWPERCEYWKDLHVLDFLEKYKFTSKIFYGCAYGLKTRYNTPIGQPLKTPWCVSSNQSDVLLYLDLKRNNRHLHGVCRGESC